MKILLVTPPYHSGVVESAGVWMNVAFVYLAGSLRRHGHEVEILDAMSRFDDHARIRSTIAERHPDLVGVTAITASLPDAVEVCRGAKEVDPRIATVLGNVHPTFMWHEVLSKHGAAVDYVVRGEGEATLAELADALATGADPLTVAGVMGLRAGVAVAAPARALAPDLDALPAAWDLVDWPLYTYRPKPGSRLAVVSSSRGCEFECRFCSQQLFWRQSWRGRTPESFVAELELLAARHGVNVAMLADETPTMDRARWERLLALLIERRLGIELLMETRVDHILRDQDLLGRYREAGISHIYVGVEATDQATLDQFHKDTSVEQSRRAIELINVHGMVSETSFVLGMPEETPERIAATIALAQHYGPDLAFFLAITPWPYAQMYAQLRPHIEELDYRHYNLVEPVIRPVAMTRAEVAAGLARASREFYLDKLGRLDRVTPEKRQFLLRVMRLLMDHSYLGPEMKAMSGEMPEWVRAKLAALGAAGGAAGGPDAGTGAAPERKGRCPFGGA